MTVVTQYPARGGGTIGWAYGVAHDVTDPNTTKNITLNYVIAVIYYQKNFPQVARLELTLFSPNNQFSDIVFEYIDVSGQDVGTNRSYVAHGDNLGLNWLPSTPADTIRQASGTLTSANVKIYGAYNNNQGFPTTRLVMIENTDTNSSHIFEFIDYSQQVEVGAGVYQIDVVSSGYNYGLNGYSFIPFINFPQTDQYYEIRDPNNTGFLKYYIYDFDTPTMNYRQAGLRVVERDSSGNIVDSGIWNNLQLYNFNIKITRPVL